jgi:hypothetical protein
MIESARKPKVLKTKRPPAFSPLTSFFFVVFAVVAREREHATVYVCEFGGGGGVGIGSVLLLLVFVGSEWCVCGGTGLGITLW